MSQATIESQTPRTARRGHIQLERLFVVLGAMLLGAALALAANAVYTSMKTVPAAQTSTSAVTDNDRAIVQHSIAERAEVPVWSGIDRSVVQHLESERNEAPAGVNNNDRSVVQHLQSERNDLSGGVGGIEQSVINHLKSERDEAPAGTY